MSPRTIYVGRLMDLYCVLIALAMISHKKATVGAMTALVHDAKVVGSTSLSLIALLLLCR